MKVLVINVCGWQLAYVGCYGNEWIQTPTLDRLAAEGVVFDQHVADGPDPAGARRAWRSGCFCFPMMEGWSWEPDPANDLISLLRARGISTCLVRDKRCPRLSSFYKGWGSLLDASPGDRPAHNLEKTLESWVQGLDLLPDSAPWLLWLELADLLPPWKVPREYLQPYLEKGDDSSEEEEEEEEAQTLEPLFDPPNGPIDPHDDLFFARLQGTYAAAVNFVDAGLDLLMQELVERKLFEQVLLVITTDFGLPLGEHGLIGWHRPWLHEELVHLPLLMHLPGGVEAGRRIPALTQPVDLVPTLLEAFGLPLPPLHGHSLLPLAHGEIKQVRSYACSGLRVGGTLEWALRSPEWSYLLPVQLEIGDPPRLPQLYTKPDDRWEVNDIVQHHPERAAGLEQALRGFVEATRRPGPLQPPDWGR